MSSVRAGAAAHVPIPDNLTLLATLIASAGLTTEQVQAAAALAGSLAAPATAVPALGSAVTVGDFYRNTLIPMARAERGDEPRGGGTFRTWNSYWRVLVDGYPYQRQGVRTRTGIVVGGDPVDPSERLYDGCGDRPIREVTRAEVSEAMRWCVIRTSLHGHWQTINREKAGRHARISNGEGSRRNAVGAFRYFFRIAAGERLLEPGYDPTDGIWKPPRKAGNRRAFSRQEYHEVWTAVISGGDDPALDALLVETAAVTGARREGLINLNLRDVDPTRATIRLDEKGTKIAEQPATVDLADRLLRFAADRGSTRPDDPVFNYADALRLERPHRLTSRRFDTLHQRIQGALPWADHAGVSLHWFRHHAISQVERIAGGAVAARYARHSPRTVTAEYAEASMAEVCRAVGIMTGTTHPLADGGW